MLWLRGENQGFQAVHRSSDPHGAAPPPGLEAPALVAGRPPRRSRPARGPHGPTRWCSPAWSPPCSRWSTPTVDADTEQVLQALLSTAAASLESAHLHSTARELADLDGLTHLPNRRRFELDIDTEWERCRRYGRPMSMVMMDLDHFKRLNDEHGHLLGDEVLREVARRHRGVLRSTDTAYRYGGEEIVVLLRETGLEDATAAAERLREAVAQLSLPAHPRVSVTGSAGVADPQHRDGALHRAGRRGRRRALRGQAAGPRPGRHRPRRRRDAAVPRRARRSGRPRTRSPPG